MTLDELQGEPAYRSATIAARWAIVLTIIAIGYVFTRGAWHIGSPSFGYQGECALLGGHVQTLPFIYHCIAGSAQ